METISTVIIGAGPAGLAMSRSLGRLGIDHVVLERGTVANSWRTERWDSLRLLTPNWMTRLPGCPYDGADPDGYATAAELVAHLDRYACDIAAPVITECHVEQVVSTGDGFVVSTADGSWRCRSVVVATGACSTSHIPGLGVDVPGDIRQVSPIRYVNADDAPGPHVLVVGASASGMQLAEELVSAGRRVTLAVGAHTRLPRTYRGHDIHRWMDVTGLLDTRYDEVDDISRARRMPSVQLIGSPERRNLDLNLLTSLGVEMVGRLCGIPTGHAQFSGSLASLCADADLKMGRLLDQIDELADSLGCPSDQRPAPTRVPVSRTTIAWSEFSTVIWATGFRPHVPFLEQRLLDRRGAIIHDGGVMIERGMYVIGQPFLRRRKSTFLDGVGADAVDLSAHLAQHLRGGRILPSPPVRRRRPPRCADP